MDVEQWGEPKAVAKATDGGIPRNIEGTSNTSLCKLRVHKIRERGNGRVIAFSDVEDVDVPAHRQRDSVGWRRSDGGRAHEDGANGAAHLNAGGGASAVSHPKRAVSKTAQGGRRV
jgi:hypothetical protein